MPKASKKRNWLPWLKAIAKALVTLLGPAGFPAAALLTLSEELEKEESDAKFQQVAENVQQILELLPDELASRADIAEKQEELRQFLEVITDASDEKIIAEIRDSRAELANQIENLRTLVMKGIPPEPRTDDAELKAARQQYINYLIASHGTVELRGVRADQPVQIELKKLYVDLHIRPRGQGDVRQTLESQQVLQDNRKVVILGGPGSGKSTLLKRLILDFAPDAQSHLGLNDVQLPIYLRLYELARYLSVLPDEDRIYIGPQHILSRIGKQIQIDLLDVSPQFIRAALEKGHCLLLFDALDEVPSHRDREQIVIAIDAFMTRFPKNRYIIASRPYAYRDRAALAGDVFVGYVNEFSTSDVKTFLDAWYDAIKVTLDSQLARDRAEELRKDLKRAATSSPSISALTRNPLMLANIAIIHYNQRKLPERRAELYALCTELMFGLWDQHRILEVTQELDRELPDLDATARREFFERIAFWFHGQEKTNFAAEPTDVAEQLQSLLQEVIGGEDLLAKAQLLLNTIIERSGLFREVEDDGLQFEHHTFQEYLAARDITSQDDFIEFVLSKLGNSWWEEVILLAVGHLSTERNRRARTLLASLMQQIAVTGENPEEIGRNRLIAGRCLIDAGPMSVHANIREQIVAGVEELMDLPDYDDIRAEVQSVLSQLTMNQESQPLR